ncbi:MAG: DUF6599 family protein, partial [Thermoanaerobaculia bacterium]
MAFAFLIAAALSACDGRRPQAIPLAPPAAAEESFATIESPSLQFLPRQQEAQLWKLDEDPIVIPGDRLTSYLGADSSRYLRYEVLDVTIGKYSGIGQPGFATVEIYRFPDFVKAFGAYSMNKSGSYTLLSLANESFAKPHSINIWRGSFCVRVVGSGPGDSLLKLAGFVADRMPPAPGKPAVFAFLPDKDRVPSSERYSAEPTLGQAYLANSFQAMFNVDGDMIQGIVLPAANKKAAGDVLDRFRNLYVQNGKLLDPIPNLGEDNFTGEDRYLGRTVAFRIDRFV